MPIVNKRYNSYSVIDKPKKEVNKKPIKRYSTREVLELAELAYWEFNIIIEEYGFEPVFEGNTGQFWDKATLDKIIDAADRREVKYE